MRKQIVSIKNDDCVITKKQLSPANDTMSGKPVSFNLRVKIRVTGCTSRKEFVGIKKQWIESFQESFVQKNMITSEIVEVRGEVVIFKKDEEKKK